ncbi:hypothetical protein [Kitasatospora sp. NPDC098663]|uniref:hypothetical protein n=1 Tax=Kitasatospora sp. NPDC098663 TaxID=3364096 RepID=UPI003817EF19
MVAQIVKAAGRTGRAPLLILGAFERVGSNWVSDQLRASMQQHNEPFRQQLGTAHPLSALNPRPEYELTALNRHHLACALHDLHGSERHAVKETGHWASLRGWLGRSSSSSNPRENPAMPTLPADPMGWINCPVPKGGRRLGEGDQRCRPAAAIPATGRSPGRLLQAPEDRAQ